MKRREFGQLVAAGVATCVVPGVLPGCKDDEPAPPGTDTGPSGATPPPKPQPPQPTPTPKAESVFSPLEAKVLHAVVQRLLPSDVPEGTPGAKEADVVTFIDNELRKPHFKGVQRLVKNGLVALRKVAVRDLRRPFEQIPTQQQDAILGKFQRGELKLGRFDTQRWFTLVLTLTLEGYLGAPEYGGNKDGAVWASIGFARACPHGKMP